VRPEVVVLMGGVTKALCDLPLKLETHQGAPQWGTLLGGQWEGWVWPSYEPALGMRETGRMTQLIECFGRLGAWVRGEWAPPVAVETEKDYRVIEHSITLREYLRLDQPVTYHAADTEKHGQAPWSVQFSNRPHTGRLIRAERTDLLAEYQWWLEQTGVEMILHFAGQDLDTLDKMGVRPRRFRDTGQESYQLCSLPQGLKPLAYRLLGVTMRSWQDVVWPASVTAVCDWMQRAAHLAAQELQTSSTETLTIAPCPRCGKRSKKLVCKWCGARMDFKRVTYKAGAAEAVLRHVRAHTLASAADTDEDKKPYNPWDKLDEMYRGGLRGKMIERWEWEWLEENVGTTPILGIGNCEEGEAVAYAIGDADMTGRVAVELERLRGDARWTIASEDKDV
jgi:hypothetical protein